MSTFPQKISYRIVSEPTTDLGNSGQNKPPIPKKTLSFSPPQGSVPYVGVPMSHPVQSSPTYIVKDWSEPQPQVDPGVTNVGLSRVRKAASEKRTNVTSANRPEFNPYTLMDAHGTMGHTFTKMSGLGAFMVGTEEWKRKKDLLDKRQQYARQVLSSNQAVLLQPKQKRESLSQQPISNRQRAIEFAKGIKRPHVNKKQKEFPAASGPGFDMNIDPLEELEAEHLRLKSEVAGLRTHFV